MSVLPVSADQPIQISPNPLWLDVCDWTVSAGFPSPAADHTQKRVDINIYPPRVIKAEELTVWGVVTFNLHKLW
jgi:hypothetical protein